jgi:hypothetical protein
MGLWVGKSCRKRTSEAQAPESALRQAVKHPVFLLLKEAEPAFDPEADSEAGVMPSVAGTCTKYPNNGLVCQATPLSLWYKKKGTRSEKAIAVGLDSMRLG